MKLEEEIKQTKFRNQYHKLAVNIIYTHSWLMSFHTEFFEKHNLTPSQFNVLRILRGQHPKPASVNLLKERMLDKMSDASRLIERLRLKGFVDREISKDDRRKADVVITDKGLKVLEEIDKSNGLIDTKLKNLNEKETELLNNLLDKLRG